MSFMSSRYIAVLLSLQFVNRDNICNVICKLCDIVM